jgi:DNA repair protein RadC
VRSGIRPSLMEVNNDTHHRNPVYSRYLDCDRPICGLVREMVREMKDIREIREHIAVFGGAGLSEQELLTLIFGEDRTQKLLSGLTDTRYLLTASETELVQWGLTSKQAHQFRMMVRLVLRLMLRVNYCDRPQIREADQIYLLLKPLIAEYPYQEQFWVIALDTKLHVVAIKRVALGTLDSATLSPREVFRPAIQHSAACIITAHNHPSGNPTPSPEDIAMTKRITQAGEVVGIRHLDHVVIGDDTFHSLHRMGHM